MRCFPALMTFNGSLRHQYPSVVLACIALLLSGCGGSDSPVAVTGTDAQVGVVSECDQPAVFDAGGKVVLPAEATEVEPEAVVEEDLGLLADLYPGMDTSTDEFYENLPCEPSIGGVLPEEQLPTQDELDAEAYVAAFEETEVPAIVEELNIDPMPPVSLLNAFTLADCFMRTPGSDALTPTRCDSPLFLDGTQPFEGRDIIYVHGLAMDHIKDKLTHPQSPMGASHPSYKLWPQDAAEFTDDGGYFRVYAENYWRDHIREHLDMGWQYTSTDPAPVYIPKANRYLLIAWSSNQTIEFAQHAMLTQIQQAMMTNKNVKTPPNYPAAYERPFCSNGCIVITHSTGSPITSTAMSLADFGFFGAGGREIPDHIAAHISFAGAISGSRLASITMAVTVGVVDPVTGASNVLCGILDWLVNNADTCAADASFISTSILRDLVPAVAQGVWGPWINSSPVPTVTSAGGHPTGSYVATGFMLPGIDDGVVTMNSACGNPNPVQPGLLPPSGLTTYSLIKSFDMSENGSYLSRAGTVFGNQKNLKALAGPLYLAGTCTPWLSPTGMVMPVASGWAGTSLDARMRFANHYSFIQSLGEHSYDGGSSTANPWPSASLPPDVAGTTRQYLPYAVANLEESSATINNGIFSRVLDSNDTRLAKKIDVREIVRGRKISFRMPFAIPAGNCKRRGPLNYYCHVWVWKRTYHLLDKWETKQSSHYAYEFIGRR